MPNDAHVSIIGNVIQEPKNDQYNNQTRLNFTVGVKTTKKQENSQYYESDFYNVTLWGKQAENIMAYLHKGTVVWVNGDLMLRKYKDRNNIDQASLNVNGSYVKILSRGKSTSNSSHTQDEDQEPPF